MKTTNTLKKVTLAAVLTFVLSFSFVFTMYIMTSGAIVATMKAIFCQQSKKQQVEHL